MNNISRYLAFAFSLLGIGGIFYYFSDIVAYVLIAWVLSMMGQPVMDFFKKYLRLGNAGSAALTLVGYILVFVVVIRLFVPPIIQQARNLGDINYADIVDNLEEPINDWNNWAIEKGFVEGEIIPTIKDSISSEISLEIEAPQAPKRGDKSTVESETEPNNYSSTSTFVSIDSILLTNGDTITKTNIILQINLGDQDKNGNGIAVIDSTALVKETDSPLEKIQKSIFSIFNPARIPELFSSIVGFMGNFLIGIMSILFIAFFFLKEGDLFVNFLKALVPTEFEEQVMHAVDDSSKMLRRYFVGVSVQVTIISIFMWIILSIIGIKNAILIAFFAALINVIPYLGPIIGAAFGVFITISSNLDLGLDFYSEMLPLILKVIAAFGAMQLLDNFLLQPFIFSNSVLAHPLEIFIIILIGAKLSGILGMILAIPVYTVIRVIARAFLSEFKIVQKLTGHLNDVGGTKEEEENLEEEKGKEGAV